MKSGIQPVRIDRAIAFGVVAGLHGLLFTFLWSQHYAPLENTAYQSPMVIKFIDKVMPISTTLTKPKPSIALVKKTLPLRKNEPIEIIIRPVTQKTLNLSISDEQYLDSKVRPTTSKNNLLDRQVIVLPGAPDNGRFAMRERTPENVIRGVAQAIGLAPEGYGTESCAVIISQITYLMGNGGADNNAALTRALEKKRQYNCVN